MKIIKKVVIISLIGLVICFLAVFLILRFTSYSRAIKKEIGKYNKNAVILVDGLLNQYVQENDKPYKEERIILYTGSETSRLIYLHKDTFGFWNSHHNYLKNNNTSCDIIVSDKPNSFDYDDCEFNMQIIKYICGDNAKQLLSVDYTKIPKGYSVSIQQMHKTYVVIIKYSIGFVEQSSFDINNISSYIIGFK